MLGEPRTRHIGRPTQIAWGIRLGRSLSGWRRHRADGLRPSRDGMAIELPANGGELKFGQF